MVSIGGSGSAGVTVPASMFQNTFFRSFSFPLLLFGRFILAYFYKRQYAALYEAENRKHKKLYRK
jgi:hypothetical protein